MCGAMLSHRTSKHRRPLVGAWQQIAVSREFGQTTGHLVNVRGYYFRNGCEVRHVLATTPQPLHRFGADML
jgi:hypothetical protein